MSQSVHTLLAWARSQVHTLTQRWQHFCGGTDVMPMTQVLAQIKNATAASELQKAVNLFQERTWILPQEDQSMWRNHLVELLITQVLHATQPALRLEAARWLRALTQMGLIEQPQRIFVTLVTATTSIPQSPEALHEQRAYLQMILDCFRSFHPPSPAFPSYQFPAPAIFTPLVPLLRTEDKETQEILRAIFAEASEKCD